MTQGRKAKHKPKNTKKGYTNMSNQSNTRKARVTSNDIVMAYMLEGIDSLSRSLVDHTNTINAFEHVGHNDIVMAYMLEGIDSVSMVNK